MKRTIAGRIFPRLIMTAGIAIPIATTAEILRHATTAQTRGPLSVSQAITPPSATQSTSAPVPITSKSSTRTQRAAARKKKAIARASKTAPKRKTASASTHSYTGPAIFDSYGSVRATITVTNNRITNVAISAPGDSVRSSGIASQAVPLLRQETLQAQSAQIDTVSGATTLSQAYFQSLQAALDQAHL